MITESRKEGRRAGKEGARKRRIKESKRYSRRVLGDSDGSIAVVDIVVRDLCTAAYLSVRVHGS